VLVATWQWLSTSLIHGLVPGVASDCSAHGDFSADTPQLRQISLPSNNHWCQLALYNNKLLRHSQIEHIMSIKPAAQNALRAFLRPRRGAQVAERGQQLSAGRTRGLHYAAQPSPLTTSSSRHRPAVQPFSQPASLKLAPTKRTIFIQTEDTPNADALKFKPNHRVLPEGISTPFLEYLSPRSTLAPPYPSPLAAQLMNVDGVTSVFYGADYITVTKDSSHLWAHIKPEVFSLITETVTSGQPIVNQIEGKSTEGQDSSEEAPVYDEADEEVVGMIQELLETRIRPAIQEDGGDIEFRGFQDGQVMLKLRGACRTCDSSTVTLKNGIEVCSPNFDAEPNSIC